MEDCFMEAIELSKDRVDEFKNYCRSYRKDLDDSFLYDEDLERFKVNKDNPSYVVLDEDRKILATVSLILDEYNRKAKKGRFRIIHSRKNDIKIYKKLLQSILKDTEGLEKIFTFVPMENKDLIHNLVALNFKLERYSFLMKRDVDDFLEINLPNGYTIEPVQLNGDEDLWVQVRNKAFAQVKGNEAPLTANMVKDMALSQDYIEGGLMILYHKDKAVGSIRCSLDEYEAESLINIGSISVLPEYQSKGLGKILLRTGINFARKNSYKRIILCVNGDNEKAKSLYIKEGFKQVKALACYYLDCH